jgi:hypothetical protein
MSATLPELSVPAPAARRSGNSSRAADVAATRPCHQLLTQLERALMPGATHRSRRRVLKAIAYELAALDLAELGQTEGDPS